MLTAKQLEDRRRGIGGSDAAAALGLSPWMTPRELYEAKTDETVQPIAVSEGPMLWGHLLEPLIRQRYAERTGRQVRVPDTIWSTRHPFMLAHLDGFTDDGGALRGFEAKTARTADGWGEPGTDAIPQTYLLQVQHCMIVAEIDVFDVCVLIGGSEERSYVIEADRELQELIIDGEHEFWRNVETRTPPDIDLSAPRAVDLLRKMYPGTDGSTLVADESLTMWRTVMEQANEQALTYTRVAEGARAHLLASMRSASTLKFPDGKAYRRKLVTRKAYTVPEVTYMDARLINAQEK